MHWQHGSPPTTPGRFGGLWAVPYDDGVSMVFNVTRAYIRMENSPISTYALDFEKSAPGSTFSGTVVASLSISGSHEAVETSFGGATVTSGDIVGIFWTAIGDIAATDSITTIVLEGQQQ
jgi:hypothetical protein